MSARSDPPHLTPPLAAHLDPSSQTLDHSCCRRSDSLTSAAGFSSPPRQSKQSLSARQEAGQCRSAGRRHSAFWKSMSLHWYQTVLFFLALVGPHETLASRQHLCQDSTRMERITNLMASSPRGQITAPTSLFHAASPSAHSRFLLLVHLMFSGALGVFHLTEKVFLFLEEQEV